MELSQLDKIYLSNLINYNKVVNQRNKLLKELSFSYSKEMMDTLDIWDIHLVKYGKELIKQRIEFVKSINNLVGEIHKEENFCPHISNFYCKNLCGFRNSCDYLNMEE